MFPKNQKAAVICMSSILGLLMTPAVVILPFVISIGFLSPLIALGLAGLFIWLFKKSSKWTSENQTKTVRHHMKSLKQWQLAIVTVLAILLSLVSSILLLIPLFHAFNLFSWFFIHGDNDQLYETLGPALKLLSLFYIPIMIITTFRVAEYMLCMLLKRKYFAWQQRIVSIVVVTASVIKLLTFPLVF